MLSYDELENVAKLKRLTVTNTEKDYLQELILFSLYSQVSDELVFKEGTCLYKIYKLNRFSEDLDFTLTKKINVEKITAKLITDLGLLNIKGKVKEIKKYRNEINVRLIFNGPLYKGNKETQCFIPLNISLKERIIFEPQRKMIISFYKEIPNFEIFALSEKEIFAEKVRAIMTREKPRDIYDLWFLLTKKNLDFDINMINKKLKLYNLKFNLKDFIGAVNKKRGLWQLDLKNLILGELPEFNEIKAGLFNKLKKVIW